MTEDTAELIRKLRLGRVDVVGHGDGGNVGLLLARYHPQLVRGRVVSGAKTQGESNRLYTYVRLRLTSDGHLAAGMSPESRHSDGRVSPGGEQHWPTLVTKTKALWGLRLSLPI